MTALFFLPAVNSLPAQAQLNDIKKLLLMPGPLIEAHAEEEDQCESCHSSFDKGGQDSLCLVCHEAVESDQSSGEGFHGIAQAVQGENCKTCHTDHRGRGFNNVQLDSDTFNHKQTDFTLTGQHLRLSCPACHEANKKLREASSACDSCHRDSNPHESSMGTDCASCHTPEKWLGNLDFDHDSTDFPLLGEHESLRCASCHGGERYEFESTQCVTCHALRDVHKGRMGAVCSDCHNEDDWSKTSFSHDDDTLFALTGAHAKAPCTTCHHDAKTKLRAQATCKDCHLALDPHGGRHGETCADCHNTTRWQVKQFDHKKASGWTLPQGHTDLSCLQCHQGALDDELGNSCQDCHQADDVHALAPQRSCNLCHEPGRWLGATGFNHELTRFPLEGLHAIAPCASCHEDHRYAETPAACAACHRTEDTHNATLGDNCGQCHTPNGWDLWLFDHERDTEFALSGAHTQLSCTACHQDASITPAKSCGSCHAKDDRHAGAFGSSCDSCHKGDSFGEITWPR